MAKKINPDEVVTLKCLNCDADMDRVSMGASLVIDKCPKCGGIWLDNKELIRLKEMGDFYIKSISDNKKGAEIINKIRSCPRCKVVLKPVKVGKNKNITIDRCPDCHGIWFDRGEIGLV